MIEPILGDADNDGKIDQNDLETVLDNLKEPIIDTIILRIIAMWSS